jgi:hypothetical protein
MSVRTVRFEIDIPDDIPDEDIEAFLRFELGEVGMLKGDNALANCDLRSFNVSHVMVDL